MATLIAIEGPDKVGKETQSKLLANALRTFGHVTKRVEVPVRGGLTHKAIYWMLNNGHAFRHKTLFQFMQFMNILMFQESTLQELESLCDFIVLDRWKMSTDVYGKASGVDEKFVDQMVAQVREPAVTFVLLGDPFNDPRRGDDEYESNTEFQKKVREMYADRAKTSKHVPIDARQSKEEVHEQILDHLRELNLLEPDSL
jgi:thymidylate kinase